MPVHSRDWNSEPVFLVESFCTEQNNFCVVESFYNTEVILFSAKTELEIRCARRQ